jgi:hypothetical protein
LPNLFTLQCCYGHFLTTDSKGVSDFDLLGTIDRTLVQFCSAQWFWDQWVNSNALQIMPQRFKDKDSAVIDFHDAKKIKQIRDIFFAYMKDFTSTILEQTNVR